MPIFIYRCADCGEQDEIAVKSSHLPSTLDCPWCGGMMRRVYTAPTIILKGSGFHRNDYGKYGRKKGKKEVEGESGTH